MISPSEAGRYAVIAVIGGTLWTLAFVWMWKGVTKADAELEQAFIAQAPEERIAELRADEDSYELGDDAAPNYALYKKAHESTDDPPPKRVAR